MEDLHQLLIAMVQKNIIMEFFYYFNISQVTLHLKDGCTNNYLEKIALHNQ